MSSSLYHASLQSGVLSLGTVDSLGWIVTHHGGLPHAFTGCLEASSARYMIVTPLPHRDNQIRLQAWPDVP